MALAKYVFAPRAVLLFHAVRFHPASYQFAVLRSPVETRRELNPIAALYPPAVYISEFCPIAVLYDPDILYKRLNFPNATFDAPQIFDERAEAPIAILSHQF